MSLPKILIFTFLLIAGQYSYAACNSTHCTGKVSFIFINQDAIRVKMNQDMSQLNCELSGDQYLTLKSSHPFLGEIYKTLLAAHLSQNPEFTVRVTEFSQGCDITYITSRMSRDWIEPNTGGGGTLPPGPPEEPPICGKTTKPLPQCDLNRL